jgi:hypothetical protein
MISKNQLKKICTSFRIAIEQANSEQLFHKRSLLNNFPYACCGTTTSLLRYYLRELGIETREFGLNYKDVTHAILKYKNWIIDLTADQFAGENRPKVFVDEKDDFYESMSVIDEYDFYDFIQEKELDPWSDMTTHAVYVHDYNVIIKKIQCLDL